MTMEGPFASELGGYPSPAVVYDGQPCRLQRNPEAGNVDLRIVEIVYVDMNPIWGRIIAVE